MTKKQADPSQVYPSSVRVHLVRASWFAVALIAFELLVLGCQHIVHRTDLAAQRVGLPSMAQLACDTCDVTSSAAEQLVVVTQ